MSYLDADTTEAIIKAVEKRKCIYDKSHPDYNNKNVINNEWKKIAKEVGSTDILARKKWKKLRDYFQKSHRELTTCQMEGGKKRKWYLYDQMFFLLAYLREDKPTATSVPPVQSNEDTDEDDNMSLGSSSSFDLTTFCDSKPAPLPSQAADGCKDKDLPTNHSTASDFQKILNPRPLNSRFPQQRRNQSEFESEMMKAARRLGAKKEQNEMDEDDHFFKSIIPKMKLLSTVDKMECQGEIHAIVLKYIKKTCINGDAQSE